MMREAGNSETVSQKDELIATIEKSNAKAILIQRRSYKGTTSIDIRNFFWGRDPDGKPKWLATPRGISIRLPLVPAVTRVLADVVEKLGVETEEDAEA